MFPLKKTYTTPPAKILPDHEPPKAATMIAGEDIARVLSSKVPCIFVSAAAAPQIISYHFELENPLDLPKVKRKSSGSTLISPVVRLMRAIFS